MRKNQFILVLLNFVLFFVGLTSIFFIDLNLTPFSLNFHPALDLAVLFVAFFVLSTLYSGALTPFLFLYFGLISSKIIFSNPLGILASAVPLLIASFAGSTTGHFSSQDLNEKENFFKIKNKALIIFFIGVIIAIGTGFLAEYFKGIEQTAVLSALLKNALI